MDHKREHRTPPPLARVMGVGRQQQQQCIARSQGQNNGSKMLMEVKSINGKGSPIMYNGRPTITRRGGSTVLQDEEMDGGDTDDHNGEHDKGGPLREATHTHKFVRGYGSYRMKLCESEPLQ